MDTQRIVIDGRPSVRRPPIPQTKKVIRPEKGGGYRRHPRNRSHEDN